MIRKKIVPFDVTDEIQVQLLAEFVSLARQLVAFAFLGAVAQNADPRGFAAEDFSGIDVAHNGKLGEVNRLALRIGAGIDEDEFVFGRGHNRGNGWPFHRLEPPQLDRCRGD